jgi:hypothetical protein
MGEISIFSVIVLLLLLQVKHHYFDYEDQKDEDELKKHDYFLPTAICHSIKHGIATAVCFLIVFPTHVMFAVSCGAIDFFLHHNIDYGKTKIQQSEPPILNDRYVWGIDQLFHQFTYIGLVALAAKWLI